MIVQARDQYLWALEMKSDDVSILLGLASLFALLARCIEDQLHDSQSILPPPHLSITNSN